ncbi:protein IQ-DOMAIN 3-like isoform X2 [Trifolium pratense]|uniref:protein IQ-DOMAIN 3-like isoform X2 n=1 Tax=Trifolium pratense TaxID=57577 RepID=UPI001E68FEC5|nr:protein IQ-DOMAIN 3-like isoform X2 [Trifolium pratense]
MGKKGSWFSAVKKVFSHDSRKDKKSKKSKKKSTQKDLEVESEEAQVVVPQIEDVKLSEVENEQNKQAISLAFATAAAAGAAVAAAKAAAEVVRLTSMPHFPAKTKEELAAIKIQTAFRGYLARRALRALRGLVRLKTLVQGQSVKRQADSTLRCMQTLARLQSQVRERRIRMSEENQALQRQLQQKHEKELGKLQASVVGEEWDASLQSKEQIEAKLLQRQEAAFKRERALAYSFSHQKTWKNSSKSMNQTFMDPSNPHWGWSWLERWMATRPCEGESIIMNHNDHAFIKSSSSKHSHVLNYDNKPSPTSQKSRRQTIHNSPSTSKTRPPSSKGGEITDDSRSMFSAQSDRYRRYSSIAGSSVRDDASIESSPVFPSYMALTSSAKAKSKLMQRQSPSSISARKRLSFPASPIGSRRHSGPPKVEI